MKKFILLLTLLMAPTVAFAKGADSDFKFPASTDYPAIVNAGKKVSDFVPSHWKILGQATGDLNGDKSADVALVIKGDEAKFKQKNEGTGGDVFDTNPRMLLILFKDSNSNGYKLAQRSDTFIPIPDRPEMTEPFEKVSINNEILQLDITVFYSAGSWSTSNSSYKFRYDKNRFDLIGADTIETQRNTGAEKDCSYNFLTGKMSLTTGNSDSGKKQTRWINLPSHGLKALSSFQKPYAWEVTPGYFL